MEYFMIQVCLLDGTEDEKERTEIAKSTIINLTTQWAIAKHEKEIRKRKAKEMQKLRNAEGTQKKRKS